MNYANSSYVSLAFSAAAALTVFFWWAMRRRKILMGRFVEKQLAASIAPLASIRRKILKMVLLILAISLSIFSLARPQWGFEWKETKRTGLDILIALDVSKSMLSTDMKPNRLERSKFAVKDLMKRLNGDRIGLIAFAGTAFLQCPLTIDYNGFLLTLDDVNVGTIPRGGTSISSAIREAMDVFKSKDTKYKILVIITDGEDLEGDALATAKEAGSLGIKIYCVGVGTPEGELIPMANSYGERAYLADKHGAVVKTRLNEEILKTIAISTGGSYVRATQSEFGLVLLYDKSISKLEKRDVESKMQKHFQERFQYFLGFAIALLFIEMLISEKKGLL